MLRRSYSTAVSSVKSVAVLGAGQMGVGIAYVSAANAGLPVHLIDSSEKSLQNGQKFVDKLLDKNVSKGKLSAEGADKIKSLISLSPSIDATSDVDLVVEAVPEIPELKFDIFGKLASVTRPGTILGSNTSSISITRIAAAAKGVESNVIGIHFMNPVPVQPGVEIIRGLQTSDETHRTVLDYVSAIKKVPSTSQDTPGFIANRILMPYVNEAIITLETGIGTAEDIDSMMKNGCAMPMGPLALADFIGLDTCLAILNVLQRDTGDSKYRPSVLLKKYVDAGWLGKKSGRGFYQY